MFAGKNQVESRVVRMFWNDGLLDVLAGSGLLLMGLAWLLDLVPLGAVAPALLIPMWKPLRAKLTEPRLGYVEFSDVQQQRNRGFLVAAIAAGVVTLVGGVGFYTLVINGAAIDPRHIDPKQMVPALPACIIALMALMTAAVISQVRFLAYAGFLVLFGAVVATFDLEPGWALLAGGVTVVFGGVVTFWQFVHRYPLSADSK